jgi:hypothetical protein
LPKDDGRLGAMTFAKRTAKTEKHVDSHRENLAFQAIMIKTEEKSPPKSIKTAHFSA